MDAKAILTRWKPFLKTWGIFVLVVLGLISLLAIPQVATVLNGDLAQLFAQMTGSILAWLGFQASVTETTITSGSFAGEIIPACTPIYPVILLTAAMFAVPVSLKCRLIGVLTGLIVLLAINQVRIVSLVIIGRVYPEHFDVAHYLIWQGLIILVTALIWLIWAERVMRHENA